VEDFTRTEWEVDRRRGVDLRVADVADELEGTPRLRLDAAGVLPLGQCRESSSCSSLARSSFARASVRSSTPVATMTTDAICGRSRSGAETCR
jgi:hypothetical protein